MKVKEIFSYKTSNIIWRILFAGETNLLIEERESISKETYFTLINSLSGKIIFKRMQLYEKFWIGIEYANDDYIIFHKYLKPDLPIHKGIIVYSIKNKYILWDNNDYKYEFFYDNALYVSIQLYEEKVFFSIPIIEGNFNPQKIETDKYLTQREMYLNKLNENNYLFPSLIELNNENLKSLQEKKYIKNKIVTCENAELNEYAIMSITTINKENRYERVMVIMKTGEERPIIVKKLTPNDEKITLDSFFINYPYLILHHRNNVSFYKLITNTKSIL